MIIIQTLATENWFGLTSADKSRMWKSVCTVLAVIKNKKRAVFWWYYGFLFSLAWAQDELTQLCHLGRLIFEAEGDGDKSRSRKDHSDLPSPSSLMRVTAPPMQGALPMQEERSTLALKTKGCWEKSQPQKKKPSCFMRSGPLALSLPHPSFHAHLSSDPEHGQNTGVQSFLWALFLRVM